MPVKQKSQNNMSFFQSIKSLFKNWNVFSGTCSRKEFWYGQIFIQVTLFLIEFVMMSLYMMKSEIALPSWILLIIIVFALLRIMLFTLNWTQFVRRYHGVGLSGQYFWLNILANVFMGMADKTPSPGHIVFDIFGFAILIVCYIIASFPDGKFNHYKKNKK